jgi:hypothetical protein
MVSIVGVFMGQLDRAALLMSHADLHWALAHGSGQDEVNLQHPYLLMPYEMAEIQECSIAQEEAIERGDDEVAAQCQWHA